MTLMRTYKRWKSSVAQWFVLRPKFPAPVGLASSKIPREIHLRCTQALIHNSINKLAYADPPVKKPAGGFFFGKLCRSRRFLPRRSLSGGGEGQNNLFLTHV